MCDTRCMNTAKAVQSVDAVNELSRSVGKDGKDGKIFRRADVASFLQHLLGDHVHGRRVLSIAGAVTGVLHCAALSIHLIGHALAQAEGLVSKHAIKQVDRLLGNDEFIPWLLMPDWVRFVVGARSHVVVALDWTEFAADDHATIALHLITDHGRATPLVWKTVLRSKLSGQRSAFEDQVIEHFRAMLPEGVRVTLLADRAFGDQGLFEWLPTENIDFVIRFRECIHVTDASGTKKTAAEWMPDSHRALLLRNARITQDKTPVAAIVCVHAARMKDAWCLATSRRDLTAAEIIKLYGRRFTIEETFRDIKDIRYGMGFSSTHTSSVCRRDRMLFLAAIAQGMLTLLGAAAEKTGLDRLMKANTVKRRTHSLLRQGIYWYGAIPAMPVERLERLMRAFGEILHEQPFFEAAFGKI